MNSRWNENLASTRSDGRIKIRVFGARSESTLGQIWSKLPKVSEKLGFDVKLLKMFFCEDFDLIWPPVNPGLTRGILAKKGTLSTLMSERLHHVILDVLAAPWKENNIFGFFGVQHVNRGRTKYGISTEQQIWANQGANWLFWMLSPFSNFWSIWTFFFGIF